MKQLKTKNRLSPAPLMWSLAALTVLGFVPFLSGAGIEYNTESITRKIESLPVEQRKQLRNNYLTFHRLPEYRKIQYRTLNEDLEKRSERFKVLKNYHEWLNTIPPDDAKSILNEKDVSKKMALIQQLKQQSESSPLFGSSLFTGLFVNGPLKKIALTPRLTLKQMETLFQVFKDRLQISDEGLDELPLAEQHMRIVLLIAESQENKPTARWTNLIDDERVDELLAELDNSRPEKAIEKTDGGARKNRLMQRQQLHRILLATVTDELVQELDRRKPSEEELAEFEKKVNQSPKLQSQLTKTRHPNPLILLYFKINDADFAVRFNRFSIVLKRSFQNRPGKRSPSSDQSQEKRQRIQRLRPFEKMQRKRQRIQ